MYAASKDAQIIHIVKQVPMKGNETHNGCMKCEVRKYGQCRKSYYVHRFVWECFKDVRANCLCQSLLRTQFMSQRRATSCTRARAKQEIYSHEGMVR